jgi:hypothetical protein
MTTAKELVKQVGNLKIGLERQIRRIPANLHFLLFIIILGNY